MRIGEYALGFLLAASPTLAQPPAQTSAPLTVNVREITVDVEVYNGNGYFSRGNPITGLHQQDFVVLENGKPQTIRSFEEHSSNTEPEHARSHGRAAPTLILLDFASSTFEAQPWALDQVRRFLRSAPPDAPIALASLVPGLCFLHGFTTDRAQLLAAVEKHSACHGVLPSALMDTAGQHDATQAAVAAESEAAGNNPQLLGMAAQLNRMETSMLGVQAMQRTSNTLKAFEALARYLSAFPGRKNLIWMGNSFTDRPFGLDTEPEPEFRRAAELLEEARVAVYPIDDGGLVAPNGGPPAPVLRATHGAQSATQALQDAKTEDTLGRNSSHGTMDEIAERTGGEAYYNGDELTWAMRRVVEQSSDYYTLTYSPTDRRDNTGYHHIQVKLAPRVGLHRLAYRRGYFPSDPASIHADEVLDDLMEPGLPAVTQIPLQCVVTRSPERPSLTAVAAATQGKGKGELTGFNVNLAVPLRHVQLVADPDGSSHANLRFDGAIYAEDGRQVGLFHRNLQPLLTPETMDYFRQHGVEFTELVSLPRGRYILRVGVFDEHSRKLSVLDTMLRNDR